MTSVNDRPHRLSVPRSRGALSGVLLILLGIWGALVPFIGPYAKFAFTPDTTWTSTTGRLVLEVLPGAVAVLGGLLLLASANRVTASVGAWLGVLAGVWFVIGQSVSVLWSALGTAGTPVGGPRRQALEQIAFFSGLGAVILFLGALAVGRLSVVGVRDVRAGERRQRGDADGGGAGRPAGQRSVREPEEGALQREGATERDETRRDLPSPGAERTRRDS